jgi:phosphoribosyl 1,2-cyclic phosphodiesterase
LAAGILFSPIYVLNHEGILFMKLCVLGSGSKGNAVYLESGETKLLIDAGLSGRQIKLRLESVGVDIKDIRSILISHEHTDHIAGLRVLGKCSTVYATAGTLSQIRNRFELNGTEVIDSGEVFQVGCMRITPFSTSHDVVDPVGFVVEDGYARAAVATDLGVVTRLVSHHLQNLDVMVIESNHDQKLLQNGPYPWEVKQRVKSRLGHLSNLEAEELICDVAHDNLKHIFLAHLSEENNRPDLALTAAKRALDGCGTKLDVCSQARPQKLIKF